MSGQAILFIGRDSGTSRHRAQAFRRLGYDVFVIDPFAFFPNNKLVGLWTWHTGSLFLQEFVCRSVLSNIPPKKFDLVYVDGGELVGPSLLVELKKRFGTVINYNIDDPFSKRDGRRWRLYLQCVPLYDLVVVVRDCNVPEAFGYGARDVLRVYMSADEIAHSPRLINEEDHRKWNTDVLFVGTWMPERGPFMARLIELGIPVSIYGCRWHRAREWPVLRSSWRGPGLYEDDRYAKALQCAKINLGLLSKGNRNLCTTRSFEIPCLRSVLCAERTSEHTKLYTEDKEAVFWSDPEECARKCKKLLNDQNRRKALAASGHLRCLQNGTTNEYVLTKILERATSRIPPQRLSRPAMQPASRERQSALGSGVQYPYGTRLPNFVAA